MSPPTHQHAIYPFALDSSTLHAPPPPSSQPPPQWDWLVYTAATAFTNATQPQPSAYSAKVLSQLVTYVNTTGDHFPLSDHPECTGSAPPRAAADRARPVLGAFFAPLLIAAPPPAFVEQRAAISAFLDAHPAAAAHGGAPLAPIQAASAPAIAQRATGPALSWFSASDTHLGHDPKAPNGTVTTSYQKNVWAITEMNGLPSAAWPNSTWPASLGGGPVLPPAGVTISGDLIDSADSPGTQVNSCNQWQNFTALYGLDGTDGLLKYKCYEGRGECRRGGAFLSRDVRTCLITTPPLPSLVTTTTNPPLPTLQETMTD